jgi:hypothetical protein
MISCGNLFQCTTSFGTAFALNGIVGAFTAIASVVLHYRILLMAELFQSEISSAWNFSASWKCC